MTTKPTEPKDDDFGLVETVEYNPTSPKLEPTEPIDETAINSIYKHPSRANIAAVLDDLTTADRKQLLDRVDEVIKKGIYVDPNKSRGELLEDLRDVQLAGTAKLRKDLGL